MKKRRKICQNDCNLQFYIFIFLFVIVTFLFTFVVVETKTKLNCCIPLLCEFTVQFEKHIFHMKWNIDIKKYNWKAPYPLSIRHIQSTEHVNFRFKIDFRIKSEMRMENTAEKKSHNNYLYRFNDQLNDFVVASSCCCFLRLCPNQQTNKRRQYK